MARPAQQDLRILFAGRVGAAALLLAACSRPDAPPPPPPPPPDKVEQDLVSGALHECLTLDCERAYAHVSVLPAASPLRRSDSFRAIVYHYDADRLLRAEVEPDVTKRRAIYQSIIASPLADSTLSLAASERLARVGAAVGTAREVELNASTTAAATAAAVTADLLAKSKSKLPADQNEVRAKLEPKIFAGKATPEDVAMLRTVCKAQRDAPCLRQLDKLILR